MCRVQEGNPPRCLMDFWAQRCLEELREAEEQNVAAAQHTSDKAMADTVMDFLFASQDATTAAVVWVTVLMAEYPDVLQKVCILCVRPGASNCPGAYTFKHIRRAECVRSSAGEQHRPPASLARMPSSILQTAS